MQREDPSVRCIDQAQTQTLILTCIEDQIVRRIGGDEVTNSTCMAEGMLRFKIIVQLGGIGIDQPVIQDQNLFAVDVDSIGLFDNEWAV